MALRYQQNELNALVTSLVNLVTDVLRAGLPSEVKRFSCDQEQMRQALSGRWNDRRGSWEIIPAPVTIVPGSTSHPGFVGFGG